jgi:exonuclease VII small subunit
LRYCEKVLAEAEQRIQILAPTPDGAGTLKDFEQ